MLISDFDYELPQELIAQYPQQKRDEARLLTIDRATGQISHRKFFDILDYLNPGDCLVMNDSKVIPARLHGIKKGTGAKVEVLLIKRKENDVWESMVKPGKKLKPGTTIVFSDEPDRLFEADVLDYSEDGTRLLKFRCDGEFHDRLEELGNIPLPPYIDRAAEELDKKMYQTVYCREEGSVASPTAGLHFTEELIEKVRAAGVNTAYLTLHVGIGTFRPVKTESVEEHHMHFEEYHISEEAAELINRTKAEGGRIISVGTTSTRTMESAVNEDGILVSGSGSTDIFIYPGYEFKIVDSLITNFHLPKSTLLMLISALYEREKILDIYKEAVKLKYHFFSYGDAMFII